MTQRRIRLSVPLTGALIGAHGCLLVNLSTSGALLLVDFLPIVDSTWTVTLRARDRAFELRARIARVMPATGGKTPQFDWQTGVNWLDQTEETRREIGIMYTMLTS
jgi:hypothetical protein